MTLRLSERGDMSDLSVYSRQDKIYKIVRWIANTTLLLSSLILLFILISVTLPKIESAQYEKGVCNVTERTILNMDPKKRLHCKCSHSNSDQKCVIYYPCLQIFALYNKHDNSTGVEAMVVSHRRQVPEECSYKLRNPDCPTINAVYSQVEAFRKKWGKVHSVYKCFYKPASPARVILTNEAPSLVLTVNSTVFSAIGVISGLLLTYYKKQISSFIFRRTREGSREDYVSLSTQVDLENR